MAVIGLKNLCTPAIVYLVLSIVALTLMAIQNLGNTHMYCVGSYSCNTPSVTAIFLLKVVYIIFWTWLLNVICKSGFETISWILVLLPFVLMFILVALIFFTHFDSAKYFSFNIWSF